ncbi:MAG: hypothetical protein CML68_13575 [Rhodobacteraceae bacterium]|nr:hypothetical protein [Paracoccaceae bacterium]
MSEEWGPWVEHDGKGCPPSLIGEVALIEFKLAANDEDGGVAGQVVFTETIINEMMAELPEWRRDRFGSYAIRPDNGRVYAVADVIRYRIRKPRGLTILEDIARGVREPVQEGVG